MDEKSGSSGVISSKASSVTFSIYIAGYTFEVVFLQRVEEHTQTYEIHFPIPKMNNLTHQIH